MSTQRTKAEAPTPHNRAKDGEFAHKVLMPGDPIRATFIANQYLQDVRLVTDVRCMYGYTGTYKGRPVSVMAHGMGMPSIGIYAHELFSCYGVEEIVRVGSAGSISATCELMDIVAAEGACTDSNWQSVYGLKGSFAPIADFSLLRRAADAADRLGISLKIGNVVSHDHFYGYDPNANDGWQNMGCLCVEMEVAALYMEAARLGKKALGLLTISDNLLTGSALDIHQRETGFRKMIELAFEL